MVQRLALNIQADYVAPHDGRFNPAAPSVLIEMTQWQDFANTL